MSDELFQRYVDLSNQYLAKGNITKEFIKGYLFGIIDMYNAIDDCPNYSKYIDFINAI